MTAAAGGTGRDWLATAAASVVLIFAWSLPTSLFGMQLAAGLGAALVLVFAFRRPGFLRASPLDKPVLLFLAAVGLSLLLAPRPPTAFRAATSFCCRAVMMMIAALIETPIEPMTPIMACTPNG